jgi:hypothetical protein
VKSQELAGNHKHPFLTEIARSTQGSAAAAAAMTTFLIFMYGGWVPVLLFGIFVLIVFSIFKEP